jgi:hypothetical protein
VTGTLVLVFGVAFAVAFVGLWLFPMGLGVIQPAWSLLGVAAILLAGFASGLATRRVASAVGSFAATLLGLASAWALTKFLDPSRPEGELMVMVWAILALLVGVVHVVGVGSRMPVQPRGRRTS